MTQRAQYLILPRSFTLFSLNGEFLTSLPNRVCLADLLSADAMIVHIVHKSRSNMQLICGSNVFGPSLPTHRTFSPSTAKDVDEYVTVAVVSFYRTR